MSRAKKMAIVAIVICCVIGIGVVVWYFVASTNAPTPVEQLSENSNTEISNIETNSVASNTSVNDAQTSEPVSNTTSTTVTELGTEHEITSSLDPDQEWQLVERICTDMLSKSPEENSEAYFADNIPEKFSTTSNLILLFNSGAPFNSSGYGYTNCKVMVHSAVKISGVYNRHILNVSAVDKITAVENVLRVNIILNSSTGKVVYYDKSNVVFRPLSMVEDQYSEVSSLYDEGRFLDAQKIQAQLLLIYSYSPFIDSQYWNTISKVIEFGNSEKLSGITGYSDFNNSMNTPNTNIDIVTAIERGWLTSLDGSGSKVTHLGVPELLNRVNGYSYYKTNIRYRTDHNNDVSANDKIVNTTLTICVNDNTGKIESLVESDSTISNVPAGRFNMDGATSMKEILGI